MVYNTCCVQQPAILIQPCQMVLPSTNSTDSETVSDTSVAAAPSTGLVAGSTIAETLQGLISPGSTVYASSAAAAASTTIESAGDASTEQQSFQMVPPPIAILAPVDQRPGADRNGNGLVTSLSSSTVGMSFRAAQSTGVVQVQPQGVQDTGASLQQGVMAAPTGAAVYGTGGGPPIINSDTAAVQSQVILSMCFNG